MPSRGDLDAVLVDAFGTLLELEDPTERLRAALAERGVERPRRVVASAFAREVEHYLPRAVTGRDPASLAALRRECAGVFLSAAEADLDAGEFVPAFVGSLRFRLLPGAADALARLRRGGLALACVSNWDYALYEELDRIGAGGLFAAVVTSADAGAAKPDPRIFELALARLGVEPRRALHVGDAPDDRTGALAAGIAFEPPPLATLPERLGLGGAAAGRAARARP